MKNSTSTSKGLKFSTANRKTGKQVATFALPAGVSCPFAKTCLAKADRVTGKITDGKDSTERCFAASLEGVFGNVRISRWNNFESLLKNKNSVTDMTELISQAVDTLPRNIKVVRIHDGGDFFNESYFAAWINVAEKYSDILFYAYTKSIGYWLEYMNVIPANLRLTASKGGTQDNLILPSMRIAEIVYSEAEAEEKGLQIDHNDKLAQSADSGSFALLLHGTQKKGTKAASALKVLKKSGLIGIAAYQSTLSDSEKNA